MYGRINKDISMQKIGYKIWIITLAFLAVSCAKDDSIIELSADKPDVFTFKIHIPEEQIINSRAEVIQPGVIDNLYLLVFDAEGTFLTRIQATPTKDLDKYSVLLPPTASNASAEERKRIIHFICNYNWADFSDVQSIGKHENELVSILSVTNTKVAYWQRMELANGITQNAFPATIELLRNVAKISVIDNSIYNETKPFLAETQFALGDYYNYGTVAPFNTTSLAFEENVVCESPYSTPQMVSESAFVRAGEGLYAGDAILCYERKNSLSKTPMYIIVKGKYSMDQQVYYYKIDIVDEEKGVLFDITRNSHYIIDIQEVESPGYSTLQEAVNSPASNNLLYSVLLDDYTAISDGHSALRVEMTSKTIVEPNKEFSIYFSYMPDITTENENNSFVSIELQQDPTMPVIDPASQIITREAGKACYTAKTVATVPEYEIYTARVVLKATYNNSALRRTVTIMFRQPSEFEQMHISPVNIPASVGADVDLHFTIPSNVRSSLFPMEIFITTFTLTPNLAYNDQDKLTLDYSKPGLYRYKFIARDTGDYTLHFKTTSVKTSEALLIESELFATAQLDLKN
ncbi:hypothetical protein D0T60_16810 [Bacteroides sp. 224]|nr:hypothetical protein [Bacteroides sp. 224]